MDDKTIIILIVFNFALGGAVGAYWQASSDTIYISDMMKMSSGMGVPFQIGENIYTVMKIHNNTNNTNISIGEIKIIGEIKHDK